ncbi:MAG TPA: flagellar basal body P-ring protein FlgI [Alphaproteobacteria bacterium]|nr:flagellar basal body P-ring protein FlgI [Alphaproteobacteria bacterium]
MACFQIDRPPCSAGCWLRARHTIHLVAALAVALVTIFANADANAASRIKDIAEFEGIRDNQLIGYGLAVGLNGTGDTIRNSPFTLQSLVGMLERLGVNVRNITMDTKNVAAVMVTATLPPFTHQGGRIDVRVSAMGDATSLQGGTLLVTPMLGADGEVYGVAQGSIAIAGFAAQGQAQSVTRNVPTSGTISNGAIVEREINFQLANLHTIRLALRNPDLTTARRVAEAVNGYLHTATARVIDATTVNVQTPDNFQGEIPTLLAEIEQLKVEPDMTARVIIDETAGVIVMGDMVRVNRVAIAQGNLTIRITETPQVSQPTPFSQGGTTVTVPRTNVQVDEQKDRKLAVLDSGVSLHELVNGLNALGVGPRDLISILQSIKAAGALQADIEVR